MLQVEFAYVLVQHTSAYFVPSDAFKALSYDFEFPEISANAKELFIHHKNPTAVSLENSVPLHSNLMS